MFLISSFGFRISPGKVHMKFGIIYELCRPLPFDGFLSEEDTFWQAVEQIVSRRRSASTSCGRSSTTSSRATRCHRRPRYFSPRWRNTRRASASGTRWAAAAAVQSPGALGGNGRNPRHHEPRAPGDGDGPLITEEELGGFGVATEDSRPMLDEVMPEIVKMSTTDEYPGYRGRHFSMPPRKVLPKPLQQPHPPLWMACTQPASFDLAADYGIGVLCFGVGAPGEILTSTQRYKERIKAPRRQVGLAVNNAVAPATIMFCSEDPSRAFEMGGAAALWFAAAAQRLFAPWMGRDVRGYEYYCDLAKQQAQTDMALALTYGCVGTPDVVASGVREYEKAGFDQLIVMVQAGRIPHTEIMKSLQLFGSQRCCRGCRRTERPAAGPEQFDEQHASQRGGATAGLRPHRSPPLSADPYPLTPSCARTRACT